MSEEILEGLKDKFSPMDAHDVLTKHGGRDKDWHSLSFEHKSNLIDLAKKSKYNHKSPTGRSRGYSFHLALNKLADKAVNPDGTLKRKDMKESENLEELSKQKMAKYMNKAVYDNKNKKRQKGLDTAVKRMSKESEDYEGENLEESDFSHKKISKEYGNKPVFNRQQYTSELPHKFVHYFVDKSGEYHKVSPKKYTKHDLEDKTSTENQDEYIKHLTRKKTKNHFGKMMDLNSSLRNKSFKEKLHKLINEDYEGENLEEALHPLDAHRILNQHGGRNKSFFSMSSDQHNSLADTAKSMGYRHNKHSGKSYARAFHDHLNRTADAHVTEDGKLKPKSKWNNPPSMHEETENLDELSKKTLGSYIGKSSREAANKMYSMNSPKYDDETKKRQFNSISKRLRGVDKATNKLTKEEYENLDELDEEFLLEMDQFSDQHIQKLKKAYSTINKIDPTHPTYKKLSDKLESLPDEHLKKLAGAKIKFISTLANAKLAKRNFSNMKESISYFSDFILEGNGNDAVDIFENMISEKLLNRLNEKREEICEELFSLDELSKKTLGSYITKAGSDKDAALYSLGKMYTDSSKSGKKENERRNKRIAKREIGINTAVKKLTKESYENLDEMSSFNRHDDASELHLYGDNDHDLYQNSAQHIIKNLQRKHAKGNYDHELATKAWEHHAKRALKKYNQEFPDNRIKGGAATIKKAAEHFRDGYDEEVRGS